MTRRRKKEKQKFEYKRPNDLALLTRDSFREIVFKRDGHMCIIPECKKAAVDAHHIIERGLWQDALEYGGYFISNGASLCEEHHLAAEKNYFPPQYLWQLLEVKDPIKPKSFNPNVDYDKWGVPFKMPNRFRIKYPTTAYLPFSPQWRSPETAKDDEAFLPDVNNLLGVPLTSTIKLDGSNVQLTRERVAARNGTVADHKSFDYLKALHAQRYSHLIPDNLEVFGEWLYAKHSIHYMGNLSLQNYLYVFGVYDMRQRMWGSWDDVEYMAKILNVPTVPVIKKNVKYEKDWQLIKDVISQATQVIEHGHEGVVIRINYPFHYGQFSTHIAKYVRQNHVQTDEHWSSQPIIKNIIMNDNYSTELSTQHQ